MVDGKFCDKCGKAISTLSPNLDSYMHIQIISPRQKEYDLCAKCGGRVYQYLEGKIENVL